MQGAGHQRSLPFERRWLPGAGRSRHLLVEPHTVGGAKEGSGIKRRQCNCKRSNCLKLYCECFANGLHCDSDRCNCLSCHNNPLHEKTRREAIEVILERNPNAFRPKIVAASATSPTSGTR
jgi:hypothetical protein